MTPKVRNLHAGRFQPDLEEALVTELAAIRSGEPMARCLLVASNHLLARHLSVLLAGRLGGWLGLDILTLGGLVARLAGPELAARGETWLPAVGQELLARRIALEVPDGAYLHPLRETSGFPGALLETFRDLQEGRVAPGALAALVDARRGDDFSVRVAGLARLYARYAGELAARGLADDAGRIAAATRAAAVAPLVTAARRVLLYGIYDLNAAQRALVEAVVADRDASVFFPRGSAPEYEYADATLAWFRSIGFVDVEAAPPAEKPRQQDLWGGAAPAPVVGALVAHSQHQEVRESLRERLLAMADGAPAETIALLVPRADDYLPAVDTFTASTGIAVARTGGARRTPGPAAAAAVLLLRLRQSFEGALRSGMRTLGRRDLMAFAAMAPLERPGASPSDWDRLSLRLGIRGGPEWERRLVARIAALARRRAAMGDDDDSLEEAARVDRETAIAASLLDFVRAVRSALEAMPARGRWAQLGAALRDALVAIGVTHEPGDDLDEALRGLAAFDRVSEATDTAEFTLFLERSLHASRASSEGRPETASLRMSNLLDARGVPADTVIITGLTDGQFPRRPRQDPLLLDHERRRLNQLAAGAFTLPLKLDRTREDALLFRLAVESARRRVILTMSRLDPVTARERPPSPFLLEALREAGADAATLETLVPSALIRRLPLAGLPHGDAAGALDEGEYDLAWLGAGPRERATLLAMRGAIAGPVMRSREKWRRGILNEHSGIVASDEARRVIRTLRGAALSRVVSASRLEDYARCPQLYFLKNVLSLDVHDEPELAVSLAPADRGRLYHQVLASFIAEARERGLLPWRPDALDPALALLDEVIARECGAFEEEAAIGPALFWMETRRELRADLRRFVVEEAADAGGWMPEYAEFPFGSGAMPLELVLAGEEGEVRFPLRGRIDRIDLDASGRRARIIDYKTGDARIPQRDPLQAGRLLQLPLYARAVERVLGDRHPGITVEESLYYRVSQRKEFGTARLSGEVNRGLEARLAMVVDGLLRGPAEGRFFAFPSDRNDHCSRCDFRPVCGPGMGTLAELKSGDARMQFLAGLRDGEAETP